MPSESLEMELYVHRHRPFDGQHEELTTEIIENDIVGP